jgi:hypothetical protein
MKPQVHIPRPCPVAAEHLTPVAGGWHCQRCQHVVVDFTQQTEVEILAYLATPGRGSVCAALPAPPPPRWRHWLAAALALLGLCPVAEAAGPPVPLPTPRVLVQAQPPVTIRGQVLDDSLGTAVAGAWVFVAGTPYGAVADAQGRFELSIPADRPELRGEQVRLEVRAGHFTFQPQLLTVPLPDRTDPPALTVRLASRPGRGMIKGKVAYSAAPVPFEPETAPNSARKSRKTRRR